MRWCLRRCGRPESRSAMRPPSFRSPSATRTRGGGGGYAPFADAFRYHILRSGQESLWVDSDSCLCNGHNIPLHDFVASEHVRYTFPARAKGLFDADTNVFYGRSEPVKAWFKTRASPALVTNSHMRLRDGYLLNELARRFPVEVIP